MTLGNVEIAQHEYQRAENIEHTGTLTDGDLVDFKQGSSLMPAVPADDSAYTAEQSNLLSWGPYVTAPGAGNGLWNDDKLSNVVDKMVFVENTGKSDAYYRTIIAFECPEGTEYSQGSDKEFMMNVNGHDLFDWEEVGYTTIDGTRYLVEVATYQEALKPDEISRPSLLQVVMTHNATNDTVEKLGDTYEILVVSQAVQADGFADATTALDAAFGDITAENHPWVNATFVNELGITDAGTYELTGDIITIDTGYFHTQDVTEAVTINGNDNTVVGTATSVDAFQWEGGTIPAMSAIFSSADGSTVTVNDLSFSGTMSAIMLGHYQGSTYNNYNTVFNNVDVINTEVVSFSNNVSPAVCIYGTATLNNCNVYGTTLSPLDTDPMWPVYDVAAVNYTDVTIKNSTIGSIIMWNQAKVTVADGTVVDSIKILGNMNTTKYGLTVKAGATVNTIDLSNINDPNGVNITIEDGANVGAIVDNGVEYASIDAWKAAQ